MVKNIGELRELIKDLSDDTKIIAISDNYEMRGSMVDARISTIQVTKTVERFRDDFDNTSYSSEVYRYDDKGETVLFVRG